MSTEKIAACAEEVAEKFEPMTLTEWARKCVPIEEGPTDKTWHGDSVMFRVYRALNGDHWYVEFDSWALQNHEALAGSLVRRGQVDAWIDSETDTPSAFAGFGVMLEEGVR